MTIDTEEAVTILLVDDESRNLDVLEVVLADSGYRLIRARSGDEALRALLKMDVAAIVLDIRMPDLSGVELAQIIKGTQRFRDIPILFLTAHMLEDRDVLAGYGAGAVDYLTKPINPVILRHKVAVFAELFRKTRALAELNATLETRVQERTAALRVADQQKDEFLATLAHELRNPLAPLRLGLDLLMRPESGDSGRTLSIMNRQLDHMVRLIDDLLDVARISGGKLELKKQRVNLAVTIQTALDTCRPFFEQRRQSVSSDADASLFAFADATRLVQIVANLLHNASKFSPEEGHVRVELLQHDGRTSIRVTDSGVGIAPDQLTNVFAMFSRIDRSTTGTTGGLGIGLALSRKLAEMHDGELTVASPGLGQGSVFTFSLPSVQSTPQGPSDSVWEPTGSNASTKLSVLVIEDNQDSAELLAFWLERRSFVVTVTHSGPAGLAVVSEMRPRVVLCDIGLPEMDGVEVCRQIRELDLGYRPVMIAITGWGMQDDVRRTQAAGFDHHLVKPVAPDTLFHLLERVAQDLTVEATLQPE
jgi:signal transduction histidine kinase